MKPIIHAYKSKEPMLQVNAFVIETTNGIVAVDTTLTNSDSLAFKRMIDHISKPLLGIILTHGHPDHIAGTTNIAPQGDIPIIALQSVFDLMKRTEMIKHQQWSSMFGEEWIPRWTYPNQIVKDGDSITLGDVKLTVVDLGSGGDCDANSIWLLNDSTHAFLGDFIYHQNHTYMADGNILRWLTNLNRFEFLLKSYDHYYVGHGPTCDFNAISTQREYFLTYCSNVLTFTQGTGIFTDETKVLFERAMIEAYPNYGCQFMVGLSAERVGKELLSAHALHF
jgi:glyoxylase-like metal-dependent hydrolase (beta-lactamase superfamily II)